MGRPPIGERAMTAAERMRRMRARRAALRNAGRALQNEPPAAPGVDATPLTMVQRAWARATEVERAEIRAWVWSDCTVPSETPAIRNKAPLRNDLLPMRDLHYALSAHTRHLLAPIIKGLKAEGRKKGAMDRQALGRFADRLETVLSPGLRAHFSRMIELLHEQSRPMSEASPRTVAEIASALEHTLADYRYELPARLRPRQPTVA